MEIIRVFPRKTKASPADGLVYFGEPPIVMPRAEEVHVSCTFTWDKDRAEYLSHQWAGVHPNVKLGGVAYDSLADEFVSGRYVKKGYTITSRGCNNRCKHCFVPNREGRIRELDIVDGWNVLDNNLLQCSKGHINAVFDMLMRQPQKAEFTGGFEARLLEWWHVDRLVELKPKQIFFAYDKSADFDPLFEASVKLEREGIIKPTSHVIRCYVLIGHPNDSIDRAEARLESVVSLGITPMAMLWRDHTNSQSLEWKRFQRRWARPNIIHSR